MTVYLPYWLAGFAVLILATLLLKTKARRIAANFLLTYATVFVILTLFLSLSGTARESKVLPMIDANRAELYLRFGRAVTTLERFIPDYSTGSRRFISIKKKYDEFLLEAEKILIKAASKDPDSVAIKARLIIVAHELGRNVSRPIKELNTIKSENAKELYKLLSALYVPKEAKSSGVRSGEEAVTNVAGIERSEQGTQRAERLQKEGKGGGVERSEQEGRKDGNRVSKRGEGDTRRQEAEAANAARADLTNLAKPERLQKGIASSRLDEFKVLIDKHFRGSYRDTALIDLYKYSSQAVKLKQTQQVIEEHNFQFLKRLLFVMVFLILACFAGVLIILIQLFFLPRNITQVSESLIASPVKWDFKTIYSVFIAWQATQLLVALAAQSTIKTMNILNWGVLPAATITAMIYLISNAPGLLYVYLFAFKPHGIGFLEGIKWRTRVGKLGPVHLVLAGVMTWLAAIPIVILVFLIAARYLGSHGSSNPIISLVMEAAHASNLSATAIFYFTLGVLAPFCEESLFRGFLYSALRKHFGVFLSILISGSLFAAVHLDIGGFLLLMCLGCLFGFLLERTQSILPSTVAHGLWNSGTFTLVLMLFAD